MRTYKPLEVAISTILLVSTQASHAEISGTWEQEASYGTSQNSLQKLESVIDGEWAETAGSFALTAITRIRLDTESNLNTGEWALNYESRLNDQREYIGNDGKHGEITLRELYFDAEFWGGYWRVGKQQVVWGQSDGLKVLDQVNPQSFGEFILDDFDDSRIPLWMLNVEVAFKDDTLQILWIPDASTHALPDLNTPYALTSNELVPSMPVDAKGRALIPVTFKKRHDPKRFWADSDVGLRYSIFTDSGWDITYNYLYHYQDLPVLYQQVVGSGVDTKIEIMPTFKRSHLLGGTLSNALGDFTLRGEWGYSTDTYFVSSNVNTQGIEKSAELSTVVGLDYQGISDMFISLQWFQSHLFDYEKTIIRNQNNQNLTLLVQHDFMNETLRLESLFIHNLSHEDGLARPKIIYQLSSDVEVYTGADIFYGKPKGLFGQFSQQDRVSLGFKIGF